MALIRLQLHEHPASPQHEMRQKSVLDSKGNVVGTVANLYVELPSLLRLPSRWCRDLGRLRSRCTGVGHLRRNELFEGSCYAHNLPD
jgi:hypothetical protein